MTQELSVYEKAKYALAEYKTVDEVKDLRDKAMAIRIYAKQANDKTLEQDALEARMRAERRLGDMMKEMEKAKGGELYRGDKLVPVGVRETPTGKPITLEQMGIDKNLAKSARTYSAMTDEEFEAEVEKSRKTLRVGASRRPQVPTWKDLIVVTSMLNDVQKDVYKYKPEELRNLHDACTSLITEIDKCSTEGKVKWLSSRQ